LTPLPPNERAISLDALRGLALLGVLLVNDVSFFRVSLFEHVLDFHTHPGAANHWVDALVACLLEYKAFPLFSLLFGIGIGVQSARFAARGTGAAPFLARRFAVLLGIGLVHEFLISNVDILCLYAVCGALVLPLLRCPAPLLAGLGTACVALAYASPFGDAFVSTERLREHAQLATAIYSTGGPAEVLAFRWHETRHFILPLLLWSLPQTLGLMLLGIAAWRGGVVQHPAAHRRLLIAVALAGGVIGATATGIAVWEQSAQRTAFEGLPTGLLNAAANVPLALAYAAAFLLWMAHRRAGPVIRSIAALGQMSLTNYLLQSIILGLIFYSHGLGLIGRLGSAPAAAIGIAIYLGQIILSRAWLRHYRFGPAEWLWRSLTYGKRQPMRRAQ
jgi:uncharacterized protein